MASAFDFYIQSGRFSQDFFDPRTKGTFLQGVGLTPTPIKPVIEAITSREGLNDGIVPTTVAKYDHAVPFQDRRQSARVFLFE
jgi:hypothetical protein